MKQKLVKLLVCTRENC